jgi:hypothetical protein
VSIVRQGTTAPCVLHNILFKIKNVNGVPIMGRKAQVCVTVRRLVKLEHTAEPRRQTNSHPVPLAQAVISVVVVVVESQLLPIKIQNANGGAPVRARRAKVCVTVRRLVTLVHTAEPRRSLTNTQSARLAQTVITVLAGPKSLILV